MFSIFEAYPGGSQGSVVSRGWPRWRQGRSRSTGGKWPGTTATTLEISWSIHNNFYQGL